jgi:hypothetical protein
MEIRHKNNLQSYLSDWHHKMQVIKAAAKRKVSSVTQLPRPVKSFARHKDSVCLMLELLDNRLTQMEDYVKDNNPNNLESFSKAYSETMTFIDSTYIFLKSLLDDVAGIIEYFYKSNGVPNFPSRFSKLLNKAKEKAVPKELILILQPCQEWFPELRKQRHDIIHHYETIQIGFVLNPKRRGWTSIQFSGRDSASMGNGGVGIKSYLGILLAGYQRFIDDLLDLWDKKFMEWYGIVSSRNSRTLTILEDESANMLFWASIYGGYTDEGMTINNEGANEIIIESSK